MGATSRRWIGSVTMGMGGSIFPPSHQESPREADPWARRRASTPDVRYHGGPMPRRPARKGSSPVAAPVGALAPGTVLATPVLDGRWTAYQVVSVTDGMPAIVALDWLGHAPPTPSEAGAAGLLRLTHHNWKGDLQHFRVSPGLPPSWRVVGVLPPPEL